MSSPLPEGFECEESIRPYLEKIFKGEYDVPLEAKGPLVILDIGANVGAFTIWALKRWPGSTVHAYEPNPRIFPTLVTNMRHANLTANYVHLNEYGIGNPGIVPLYFGKNNSGEATIYTGNLMSSGTGVHVEIKDPLSLPNADILKMDTEGCEVDILRPLIEDGRKFSAIMFEYHRVEDRRTIDRLLEDYVLTSSFVTPCPAIGTMNYVHKDFMSAYL